MKGARKLPLPSTPAFPSLSPSPLSSGVRLQYAPRSISSLSALSSTSTALALHQPSFFSTPSRSMTFAYSHEDFEAELIRYRAEFGSAESPSPPSSPLSPPSPPSPSSMSATTTTTSTYGPADEPSPRNSPYPINRRHRVFGNSDLSLKQIHSFGFDYDYTLAQYTERVPELIYARSLAHLIQRGYPEDLLQVRGCMCSVRVHTRVGTYLPVLRTCTYRCPRMGTCMYTCIHIYI